MNINILNNLPEHTSEALSQFKQNTIYVPILNL